jgi:hypothetical protein
MAFVKLDTGILDSTLWIERDLREVFITALLMAEPYEVTDSVRQLQVDSLETTGFMVPPGWYGLVRAAGLGIVNRAGVQRDQGLEALRRLGSPELESRSQEFDGRRMVRVNGGYLILNYMKYRDKDHTAAERQRRLRERRKQESAVTRNGNDVTRNITDSREQIADAELKNNNKNFSSNPVESNTKPEDKCPF